MGWQEDRGQDSRHGHTFVPHLFGTAKNLSLAPKDFIFFISDFETQQCHFTQMLATCISSLSDVVVVVVVDYDDFGEKH